METLSFNLGMDPETFLRDYWQKKPLHIKGAMQGHTGLLDENDLAGLACEDQAESRLVYKEKNGVNWAVESGPFSPADLEVLPETGWSLLVQDVDKFLPDVARFRSCFRFVPDWRLDDIMISFSPEGGGVGPHVDLYDVFLVQGKGVRRWEIENRVCNLDEEPYLENSDLRVLTSFSADQSWDMEPGDVLYLPPGVPHRGTSLQSSMTWSVGFRSPSASDILTGFSQFLSKHLTEDQRYTDPDLRKQPHPAEITRDSLLKIKSLMTRHLENDDLLTQWFGSFITSPKGGDACAFAPAPAEKPFSPHEVRQLLINSSHLTRDEGSLISWTEGESGKLSLFVNGTTYVFDISQKSWIEFISSGYELSAFDLTKAIGQDESRLSFLTELISQGIFYPES